MDYVILVDERDTPLGTMEKLAAHQIGALHRAFSVFLFHPDGRMLVQQRAWHKYHSGGLWSNACCSHPRPGELLEAAAHRRLTEELGIDCPLEHIGSFRYRVAFENGLIEHEFDHVFIGVTDAEPKSNPDEIAAVSYEYFAELQENTTIHPERYTYWFRESLPLLANWYRSVY